MIGRMILSVVGAVFISVFAHYAGIPHGWSFAACGFWGLFCGIVNFD